MTTLPRAITSPELTKLRRENQWSRLYLAIHNPAVVYTARVNGTPSSTNKLAQFNYDGGSGTLANVKVGMTLWVGSSAGAYDKGQARVRLVPSGSVFYIGEESEIDISDNDYVTVVDEFLLWPRHIRIDGLTPYMDYDVAYSDQHTSRAPIPVLNMHAVLWLEGASVSTTFDASDSWVPGGGTNSYSWTAIGASATSGMTTATPTITYNAAGVYRVSCAVTINGVTTTGYRYVFVFSAASQPVTQFAMGRLESGEGGWSFGVTLYDEATRATVRDRAMVILFARDFYGDERVSLGYVAGRENILAIGWIQGESITWSPEQSSVAFEIRGPQYWLGQMTAFPTGLEHTNGTPSAWTQYQGLTVDAMLWHFLFWRTTAPLAIDCRVTSDTRLAAALEAPATSLWEQLNIICYQSILARVACDRYGRLFEEIEPQYQEDRSAITEVMELTQADWLMPATFERSATPQVSMVDASGVYYDGTTPYAYCALSNGNVYKRLGRVERIERLLISGQAQIVTLAGLMMGRFNNEWPRLPFKFSGANRFLDIIPAMYFTLSLDVGDTPRGVSFTLLRLLPRRISFSYDATNGMLLPEVEFEGETLEELAIATNCPTDPPELTGSTAPTAPPMTGTGGASGDTVWEIEFDA